MCRCSNGSLSLKQWSTPQISQPYTIMGTTKVSKSFSRRLQGLCKPTVFFILNQAFLPFSISNLLEMLRLPVYLIVTPRKQYDFTVSRCFPFKLKLFMYVLPFELNTMAFDFSWFTSSFQEEQTLLNTFKECCSPSCVLDNSQRCLKTVSYRLIDIHLYSNELL